MNVCDYLKCSESEVWLMCIPIPTYQMLSIVALTTTLAIQTLPVDKLNHNMFKRSKEFKLNLPPKFKGRKLMGEISVSRGMTSHACNTTHTHTCMGSKIALVPVTTKL